MFITLDTFHDERSALNAAASLNTTHHPNVENNGQERWMARNDPKKSKNKSATASMNKKRGIEVYVLEPMFTTFSVFQFEILALKSPAFENTTHHPNVEKNGQEGGWQKTNTMHQV